MLWLGNRLALSYSASRAIVQAQARRNFYVSPISAWEIGAAATKKNVANRPPLNGLTPDVWFALNLVKLRLKLAPLTPQIAVETARLPALYGSGDPGDCFLLATAHIRKLTLITRDARILSFAKSIPDYLSVIQC